MDLEYLRLVGKLLRGTAPDRQHPIRFDPGLTDAEVDRIEQKYRFYFPPDLRALLQYALPLEDPGPWSGTPVGLSAPIGEFPDWRHESDEVIRWRLAQFPEG